MFYHKFKHNPSFCCSCNATERFEISISSTEKKYVDVPESVYRRSHPVPDLVTDLPSLQAAGINPQLVNVSRLLDPVSPSSMEAIANKVFIDVASHLPASVPPPSESSSALESQTN